MKTPFTIEKLSAQEGAWRIDWFGDVAYPDLNRRQSQPSIAVQLSRHPRPHPMRETDKKEIWLPIGLLPFLKVGDIWQYGQATGENTAPTKEAFLKLNIGSETTSFYKAGGKPNSEKYGALRSLIYWLPIHLHPWHSAHTHSNCIVITDRSQLQIIIPCMELIRFYFGSSSSLLSTLFKPTLTRTELAKQYIKRSDESVFLRLADGISGASAADIARILYSPAAWNAASLIGKSALSCSSLGLPIYPKCRFPFDGTTDLHVSGQWLRHDGSQAGTFIVYEILSCSHEFPFKSIRYVATGNKANFKQSGSANRPAPQKSERKNDEAILLTDSDPDEKRQTKYIQFISLNSRFPDLENKSIFRKPSFSVPKGQPYSSAPPSSFSVGATGQGKGIAPVEIESDVSVQHFDITELPEFFQTGLATLQHALSFTLMTPYTHTTYTILVPLIHDAKNTPYSNCFTQDDLGQPKRRLMGCVQVDYVDHVEGTLILEPIIGNIPEIISFDLAEDFFDLELIKKQLLIYWMCLSKY